jgi:[FeFe] hydrogenase H-cluster maturation GTPase HydF
MAKLPRGERLVISCIGNRNVGKSSLINAIIGQEVAIVSAQPGTTTDPVHKVYELIPIGPVSFFDTAGLDDIGEVGSKRISATKRILRKTDLALIIIGNEGITDDEKEIIAFIKKQTIPCIIIFNKSDIAQHSDKDINFCKSNNLPFLRVSALTGHNIDRLRELLIDSLKKYRLTEKKIIGDLVQEGDIFILVAPIDSSAPKGRLILPQVQVLREVLDHEGIAIVVQPQQLNQTLKSLSSKPKLVITDSQALEQVIETIPEDYPLTTFSILFARYKGELEPLIEGAKMIDQLEENDTILIAEACSHHVQKDDIGRIKIPQWMRAYTGKDINFKVVAGSDFPEDMESYKLVIHCGGCMLNRVEMQRRIRETLCREVPITNYGVVISKLHGVLDRTLKPYLKSK